MRHVTLKVLGHDGPPSPQPLALSSHARETVHGCVGAEVLLSVLPSIETPGFDLLSPRSAHVLLALIDHIRRFGYVAERHHGAFTSSEPKATWTVQGVATALGIHRNQAGRALGDLTELGYLIREDLRRHGQYGGFAYALRLPADLTPQGKAKLKKLLHDKHIDLEELKSRALRYLSEEELDEILMQADDSTADEDSSVSD